MTVAQITPTRSRSPVRALLNRLRTWRLRVQLADARMTLERVEADIDYLPHLRKYLQCTVEAHQLELADLELARRAR